MNLKDNQLLQNLKEEMRTKYSHVLEMRIIDESSEKHCVGIDKSGHQFEHNSYTFRPEHNNYIRVSDNKLGLIMLDRFDFIDFLKENNLEMEIADECRFVIPPDFKIRISKTYIRSEIDDEKEFEFQYNDKNIVETKDNNFSHITYQNKKLILHESDAKLFEDLKFNIPENGYEFMREAKLDSFHIGLFSKK